MHVGTAPAKEHSGRPYRRKTDLAAFAAWAAVLLQLVLGIIAFGRMQQKLDDVNEDVHDIKQFLLNHDGGGSLPFKP